MRRFPRKQWAGCALPVEAPKDPEANVRVMEMASPGPNSAPDSDL